MADSISAPIVEALQRALAEPDGLPLVTSKQTRGLFAGNAAGKQAAQDARAAGLVALRRTEPKGKSSTEYFALTDKGLACLLEQTSARPVLEALLLAMERCEGRLEEWTSEVARCRGALTGLRDLAEKVLTHLQKPDATLPPWSRNGHAFDAKGRILEALDAWQAAGNPGDCPLPTLFEQMRVLSAKLTTGQFHDALRTLHEQEVIYLHPWTGPLYELPQPALSLLVGHEVAYYASLRA